MFTWYNDWNATVFFLFFFLLLDTNFTISIQYNLCDLILILIQCRFIWINIRYRRYMLKKKISPNAVNIQSPVSWYYY